jgi:hypothetical protein
MRPTSSSIWALTITLGISSPGCLSHERDDAGTDAASSDAAPSADAASADAVVSPDAPRLDAGPRACGPDDRWVEVRVEPITLDVARCDVTHVMDATLIAVEPAPDVDGVRVRFDFCPAADADCRCDVILTNVGTDVASELTPLSSVTVDLHAGADPMSGPYLVVQKVPSCECLGCGCALPLHLYAGSGLPGSTPGLRDAVALSLGDELCPATDCTFGGSRRLLAMSQGVAAQIPGGATADLGATRVRSVRDLEVLAPCAACAGCGQPYGAWIAWVP